MDNNSEKREEKIVELGQNTHSLLLSLRGVTQNAFSRHSTSILFISEGLEWILKVKTLRARKHRIIRKHCRIDLGKYRGIKAASSNNNRYSKTCTWDEFGRDCQCIGSHSRSKTPFCEPTLLGLQLLRNVETIFRIDPFVSSNAGDLCYALVKFGNSTSQSIGV